MSLQAHHDVAALGERVHLELPSPMVDRLRTIAIRHGISIHQLADYILRDPSSGPKAYVDGRTIRAVTNRESYGGAVPRYVVCRRGGRCQNMFRWRDVWRCGCPNGYSAKRHVYFHGPVSDACISCGAEEGDPVHSVGP